LKRAAQGSAVEASAQITFPAKAAGNRADKQKKAIVKQKPARITASTKPGGLQKKADTFRMELAKSLETSGAPKRSAAKAMIATPAAKSTRKPVQSESAAALRTISVNLRLSLAEHARMRAGASAAGVNLATYIRENTLQVSKREIQIPHERKARRSQAELNETAVAKSTTSFDRENQGLLSRLGTFWFGKRFVTTA
jgi:hypothetical protein